MMDKDKEIEEVLNYDSLHEAEKLTGKSYKIDKTTETLGFMNHLMNVKRKEELLDSMGDSGFSNSEEDYLKIVKSIGFKSVLIEPFTNKDNIEERLHVLWHGEFGILLVFNTYTYTDDGSWAEAGEKVPKPKVNGGTFYYNWSPNIVGPNCVSTGSYVRNGDSSGTYSTLFNPDLTPHFLPNELRSIEPKWGNDYEKYNTLFGEWCNKVSEYEKANKLVRIWSGSDDCREAIKYKIRKLVENGTFIKKWKKPPFLWLLHYMDTKVDGYDHQTITASRIEKLPKEVIDNITE